MATKNTTRKPPNLSYRQRKAQQLVAQSNRDAISNDIELVLQMIDREVNRISLKHRRTEEWVSFQLYQTGRMMRVKRAVSVHNAAKQIGGFLNGTKGPITDKERKMFKEAQTLLSQNGNNPSILAPEIQSFLKIKTQSWRDLKQRSLKNNNKAIIQDANHTLKRLGDELLNLNERTGVESYLFAVKGKPEHTMNSTCFYTTKAKNFLLHSGKKSTTDIAKDFEAYTLMNVQGLISNHNDRLVSIKKKIRGELRDGLISVTGDTNVKMQYDKYKKLIVVERGIKLINWPSNIPFVNPSELTSLQTLTHLLMALTAEDEDSRCQWINLSEEDWHQERTEFIKEQKDIPAMKKRKRRSAKAAELSDGDATDSDAEAVPKNIPAKKRRKQKAKTQKVVEHTDSDGTDLDAEVVPNPTVPIITSDPALTPMPVPTPASVNLELGAAASSTSAPVISSISADPTSIPIVSSVSAPVANPAPAAFATPNHTLMDPVFLANIDPKLLSLLPGRTVPESVMAPTVESDPIPDNQMSVVCATLESNIPRYATRKQKANQSSPNDAEPKSGTVINKRAKKAGKVTQVGIKGKAFRRKGKVAKSGGVIEGEKENHSKG